MNAAKIAHNSYDFYSNACEIFYCLLPWRHISTRKITLGTSQKKIKQVKNYICTAIFFWNNYVLGIQFFSFSFVGGATTWQKDDAVFIGFIGYAFALRPDKKEIVCEQICTWFWLQESTFICVAVLMVINKLFPKLV